MPTPPPLTAEQKQKLAHLEPKLFRAAKLGDLDTATEVVQALQQLLKPTGHTTRLLKNKNYLFEAALETGDAANLGFAISGFIGTRKLVGRSTRIYLEATALLGVCYLRQSNFDQAIHFMRDAVLNVNNITSQSRRTQFHQRLLARLDDECILAGLRDFKPSKLDVSEIQENAVQLVRGKSEDEIVEIVGAALPPATMHLIERMRNQYVGNVLPSDRKLLPAPTAHKPRELGKKATTALQRVAWRAVCHPDSELYKAWSRGADFVYDKKTLTAALVGAFGTWQISATILVTGFVALIIKWGASRFCVAFEPKTMVIPLGEVD